MIKKNSEELTRIRYRPVAPKLPSRCTIAIGLMDLLGLGVENQDRGDREITPRAIFIPALFQIANFLQLWQQFFE
ncbi:hypothetical protein QUB47_12540 [Microcoleus sp. AT9_B5]